MAKPYRGTLKALFLLLGAGHLFHAHGVETAFEWVTSGGGPKNDKTRAVAVDRAGNVFLAGETFGDGNFGTIVRKGAGDLDFCLIKLDPAGKVLWVKSIGGGKVDRGYGVATDAQGNAYVTGHYQSTDASADATKLANTGDYDVFVAKYDPDGKLLWIHTGGGKGYDYGHGIAVDGSGSVIVTGAVAGDARFGNASIKGGNSRPVFCAKFSPDGVMQWLKSTSGRVSGSGHGVAVDGANNIYIGGNISGEGAFGPQKIKADRQSAFVAKLNPEGEAQWISIQRGMPSAGVHEIAADADGRVWVVGMFKGEMEIGGEMHKSTGVLDSDGFLLHYGGDGKLKWSRVIKGGATDYCLGVATDGKGTGFVTGEFSFTATFGGATLKSVGMTDIYTAAFDAAGKLQWIIPAGGERGDNAYTMAWHPDGFLVIGGAFVAPAAFGQIKAGKTQGSDLYGAKIRLP